MSDLVVDASVAVKWLVDEPLSDKALSVLERSDRLIAPTLLPIEVANVLWKKARRSDLSVAMARERVLALNAFGLVLHDTEAVMDLAFSIATSTDCTVYDSLYVALAETAGCSLVTADERLVNAMRQRRPSAELIWLGAA